MDDEYDIDCTGTEDDMIERETDKALGAGAMSAAAVRGAVGPLVRIILALLAAIGGGSVREALARAKAWTAPVDVEAEVERAANEIREGREALPDRPMTDVIRPLVTDRARLAREVEAAGVERDTAWEAHAAVGAELAKARVETKEVYAELETVRAKNISAVGALVEIRETLGRAQTERDVARAEIARLTAELADVRGGGTRERHGARGEVVCVASGKSEVVLFEEVAMPSLVLTRRTTNPVDTVAAPSVDDFASLLDSIRRGQPPAMSAERRALAEAAVQANEARRGEDVDAWSRQLASMVAGAND